MSIGFLNTRPLPFGESLTMQLRQKGATVYDMPLLHIHTSKVSSTDCDILHHMHTYDVVVCVSTSAAWQVQKYVQLDTLANTSCQFVAVGKSTQKSLQAIGIQAEVPIISSNEGMLAMPQIVNLCAGQRVLVLRGKGGRRLLIDTLKNKGVHVDSVELYERQKPKDIHDIYQSVFRLVDTVLISSVQAWHNWCTVCDNTQQYRYLVLGERIAQVLACDNHEYVVVDNLQVDTLAQHIV